LATQIFNVAMDRVADREDSTATTAKTASTESRGGQLPHTTKTFNTKTAAAKKTKPDAEAVPAAGGGTCCRTESSTREKPGPTQASTGHKNTKQLSASSSDLGATNRDGISPNARHRSKLRARQAHEERLSRTELKSLNLRILN
jgi:hypothetical protein